MTRSQIREERRRKSQARRQRKRAVLLSGGFLLAIVLIVGITVGPGLAANLGNDAGDLNTGGPVALDRDAGTAHINVGESGSGYTTYPPTSGPHYFARSVDLPGGQTVSAPARWGVYDFALPNEVLLHNLEHGGIGLHYDCPDGCADIVQELRSFIPGGNPSLFVMSPYPGLIENTGKPIAITAWRHHLLLDEVDEAQIQEFIDEYINRAPESVPSNPF